MQHTVRAGLLPLYLDLYDVVYPDFGAGFSDFLAEVERAFGQQHVELLRAENCCTREQIQAAVQRFDEAGVDIIITLHLSYSPSLLAIDALEATRTPLLLLDTTMDPAFGAGADPKRITFNHGIHGAQDLASVLRRRRRPYRIVAGHYTGSGVIPRAAAHARAAAAARALSGMKVLRIGKSFDGMGDFFVEESVLREKLGVEVVNRDTTPVAEAAATFAEAAVRAEVELDRKRYAVEVPEDVHWRAAQAGLGLKRAAEDAGCGACTFNFLAFTSGEGPLATVPFLGASKMMADGFGYAGEGDVLTAALVGALNGPFLTNFTEMFCPDWQGNSVFLAHMGEFNPACAGGPVHMVEKKFVWTDAQNPAIITGPMKPGPGVLVNLAPGPDNSFSLILIPIEVLGDTTNPDMHANVRGWFRTHGELPDLLEWYSQWGGTHHCALVHGASIEALEAFAAYCGLPCVVYQ